MMQFHLDRAAPVPLHEQIKEQIVGLIHAGQLKSGDQLPTLRALSADLRVNVNTVAHAYRELDAAGFIDTRHGEGTFVANMAGEAEMALVISKRADNVKATDAFGHIFGYMNFIDGSARGLASAEGKDPDQLGAINIELISPDFRPNGHVVCIKSASINDYTSIEASTCDREPAGQ